MPRKDRSFTGRDVLRIYCRHLSAEQQAVVDAIGFSDCGGKMAGEDVVQGVLSALTVPPLSFVVERLPGGRYILDALTVAAVMAERSLPVDTDPALYYDYFIQLSRSTPQPD